MTTRDDGRADDELREVKITRGFTTHPAGSVLVEFGNTRVMCTASVEDGVPRWRQGSGLGWLTAEYAMLPAATHTRSGRESVKGKVGGRTQEISRLIGRSLRACIDLAAIGENTIALDCDVLQADGEPAPPPSPEPMSRWSTQSRICGRQAGSQIRNRFPAESPR